VGDNSNKYVVTLKQLVLDLKLESQVAFLGKQLDVRPLLAAADLYVIPSKKEGMPMALVEAMAMGIPVLGSDIPGIRYVLKDYEELLFPVSNTKALTAKIESFFKKDPEERLSLGADLRTYCLEHFSMKSFIDAHENLYLDL
jgi:glycosyltransferase involved in cell wall biosynthesis